MKLISSPLLQSRPGSSRIRVQDMLPLSQDTLKFLVTDLTKVKTKHLEGTSGLSLLRCATYLDLRFKDHACVTVEEREKVRSEVKAAAVARFSDASVRQFVIHRAETEIPMDATLAEVMQAEKARGRGGRGRGAKARGRKRAAPGGASVAARSLKPRTSAEDFLFGGKPGPKSSSSGQTKVQDLEAAVDHEMGLYDRMPAGESLDASPLLFWRKHEACVRHLAAVARDVLSIPASSASIERLFSAANRAVNNRRGRSCCREVDLRPCQCFSQADNPCVAAKFIASAIDSCGFC